MQATGRTSAGYACLFGFHACRRGRLRRSQNREKGVMRRRGCTRRWNSRDFRESMVHAAWSRIRRCQHRDGKWCWLCARERPRAGSRERDWGGREEKLQIEEALAREFPELEPLQTAASRERETQSRREETCARKPREGTTGWPTTGPGPRGLSGRSLLVKPSG